MSRTNLLGMHVTDEVKNRLSAEAKRRGQSMSFLGSIAIEEWLDKAEHQDVTILRSNKRKLVNPNEADVPLPFEISK